MAAGGATIDELSFTFASWRCGSAAATTSGTVTPSRTPGWPISNRAISVSVDFDPFGNSQTITLTGTFQDKWRLGVRLLDSGVERGELFRKLASLQAKPGADMPRG